MTYFIQIAGSVPDSTTFVAKSGDRISVSEPTTLKTHPWFAFSNEDSATVALIEATNTLRRKPVHGAFDVTYKLKLLRRLNNATIISIA